MGIELLGQLKRRVLWYKILESVFHLYFCNLSIVIIIAMSRLLFCYKNEGKHFEPEEKALTSLIKCFWKLKKGTSPLFKNFTEPKYQEKGMWKEIWWNILKIEEMHVVSFQFIPNTVLGPHSRSLSKLRKAVKCNFCTTRSAIFRGNTNTNGDRLHRTFSNKLRIS